MREKKKQNKRYMSVKEFNKWWLSNKRNKFTLFRCIFHFPRRRGYSHHFFSRAVIGLHVHIYMYKICARVHVCAKMNKK